MNIRPANRTLSVQEYYFSRKNREIDALSQARLARGEDRVINLGIGSPDGTPPASALSILAETAVKPGCHGYQNYKGLQVLREAFAKWYGRYYGVELDPDKEIQPLTGSKEGILLISMAYVNPGDKVLVPDPGYPTYTSASRMVDAQIIKYDLLPENGWKPDFDALEAMDLTGVKLMWTNYPGMPTGAKATPELYARLVEFGRKHNILIVNDNPYSFILNDQPLSILAVPGAKDICLEMNSLSKAHNMAGWRIGMVAGDADAISQILKVKSQMDSGMFKPLQLAAVEALGQGPEWFTELNKEYKARRAVASRIMDLVGAKHDRDSAGLFVWGDISASPVMEGISVPEGMTPAEALSEKILHEAGVFITPGFIFGRNGTNFVRISLCAPVPVLEDAERKIRAVLNK